VKRKRAFWKNTRRQLSRRNSLTRKKEVAEEFNKKQAPQGFLMDAVGKPLDVISIGADASQQYSPTHVVFLVAM
jgi:hypothetical protein